VACALDAIGDKWTLLLVRDMLFGRAHFREFLASPEGIASNILSDRLRRLVDARLVETYASPQRADRLAYRLTDRGRTLGPVLEALKDWGLAVIPGTEARMGSAAGVTGVTGAATTSRSAAPRP